MEKKAFRTNKLERLSYGSFFVGQNIIYLIPYQFLTFFYTEYVGLKISHTTILLFLAKVWDAVNDPIMGAIVDKSSFKKGKYLPWLKFVTYFLPLSLLLLFIKPDAGYTVRLIFAYMAYIIYDVIYTMSDAPLYSLSTVMTDVAYERNVLMSYGRFAAAFAAILSTLFISIKQSIGWTATTGIFCFIAFLTMFPMQFHTKERKKYQRSSDLKFSQIFKYLFKNKYLLIYYLGYLAMGTTNTLQIIAVYFAKANLGDEGMATVIMAVVILPIILIAPFLPVLIKTFGKKKLTVYCSIGVIIMSFVQYFAGYKNLAVFLLIASIRVIFMQIPFMIYAMFTTDCIEYGAYVNGERTEGMAFSIQTFITKLSGAFSNSLCLILLGLFGYVKQSSVQTAKALHGIWIIISLVPLIGFVIMLIVMKFYKLDEKMVAEMIEENERRLGRNE